MIPMSQKLHISHDLALPLAVGTQAVLVVGLRGSGKTNTAGAVAEELLDAGQPIVVIDPTDAWWGLRSGYKVLIFGGSHADLPLQETDGRTIAEFQVTEQVPFILSIRHLRKAAQRRFVTEFCEELYHLKGKPEYRAPLTVFIDEAPLFVPQKVLGEVARTVGAVEDLIARGRNAGFGVLLISQRSATVNADVRTQCDTIIAHRLTAKLNRKAISDWFEENASTDQLAEILKSLATLKDGEAWVWSPLQDLMRRVQIRLRHTYDSSATPKPGQKLRPPKALQEVDLTALKGKLAAAIEQARANDPDELKREIARLKSELNKPANQPAIDGQALARAERSGAAQRDQEWSEKFLASERERKRLQRFYDRLQSAFSDQAPPATIDRPAPLSQPAREPPRPGAMPQAVHKTGAARHTPPASPGDADAPISRPQQTLLDALAWFEAAGIRDPDRSHVAAVAGVSPRSSGFEKNVSRLSSLGLIQYPAPGAVSFTASGRARDAAIDAPQTLDLFHQCWLESPALRGPQRDILRVLLETRETFSREELAERVGVSPLSSGYEKNISGLSSLGVVCYPARGCVAASPLMFPEGLHG
ncbi:MAG: hypothetical protein IPM64_17875 [Phycisphaerales bacterium]|nr:hypothetical protein [Phycisphaerales bacterium]